MGHRTLCALACALALTTAFAQTPRRIERADDLPRFSYPVQGELETVVRDPQRFAALAQALRRDTEGTLAGYDIAELATRRQMLGMLVQLDMMEGRYDEALRRSAQIQQLQEKPADKLLSAAKMLAVKPSLKPQDVIAIMRATADRSEDGRRTLIHPARALAAVGYFPA